MGWALKSQIKFLDLKGKSRIVFFRVVCGAAEKMLKMSEMVNSIPVQIQFPRPPEEPSDNSDSIVIRYQRMWQAPKGRL